MFFSVIIQRITFNILVSQIWDTLPGIAKLYFKEGIHCLHREWHEQCQNVHEFSFKDIIVCAVQWLPLSDGFRWREGPLGVFLEQQIVYWKEPEPMKTYIQARNASLLQLTVNNLKDWSDLRFVFKSRYGLNHYILSRLAPCELR